MLWVMVSLVLAATIAPWLYKRGKVSPIPRSKVPSSNGWERRADGRIQPVFAGRC
jgi:hypothetical protein